ncbi:hypothetical protein GCK72_003721 [Caenorhabditis remanei]|uniref:Uncharacterized protein n=1 Tax=Caenorhabditis remanei TaxID=31234 RepID=A0A6A5HAA3_CAERE|nr:hypothetical protein GCK72_003721 [Caenorhabditis remanei]KAF1763776.1 hypothetical protein GCK72_003721 [Caenorhabditis remanei]
MADGGYEVMGPAHGPLAPAPVGPPVPKGQKITVAPPSAPPLPPTIINPKRSEKEADSTLMSSLDPKTSRTSVLSSTMGDTSRLESVDSGAVAVTQRPSSLDIACFSTVIFITILVISTAIPVILTGTGSADIEYFKTKLSQLETDDYG